MKKFYEIYKDNDIVTPLVTQISWTNHLLIMSGCKTDGEREFYIRLCIKENYSKRQLERQLDSGLDLCQYLGHKKLNFSPSIAYAERIISYAALRYALIVRRSPLEYQDDKETFDYAETLAEPIQRFADVLEKAQIQAKEINQ